MPQIQRFGWVPDLPDHRDYLYAAPTAVLEQLPPRVDLTDQCPEVYDQYDLGSCTAFAIAAAIQFDHMKQGLDPSIPSRLFIYYNERAMEGTIESDSGAMIRDGIKSVAKQGVCSEACWPYIYPDIHETFREKPPDACYEEALKNKVISYARITRNLKQMKGRLYSGFPFIFGFTAYDSFETAVNEDGNVPMPSPHEGMLGGHAVLAVGYDDAKQYFLVRNTWGVRGQMKGYFTLPYAYIMDSGLASDFWVIHQVQ